MQLALREFELLNLPKATRQPPVAKECESAAKEEENAAILHILATRLSSGSLDLALEHILHLYWSDQDLISNEHLNGLIYALDYLEISIFGLIA